MSGFTRVNGDSQAVAVYDYPVFVNGLGASTSVGSVGAPIQPAGPVLEFIAGDIGADPTAQFGTGGAIEAVLKTVAQLFTIHMYQFNATGAYKIAVYDNGRSIATGFGATGTESLQTALQGLGTVNGYDLSAATAALGSLIG